MVIQTRGSGIGTQTAPILSAQITAPAKMISPRIPYPAVIIPGGLCIAVVQHGVKRHLERDIHRAGVPRPDADRCAKAAARTLAASHQLVAAACDRMYSSAAKQSSSAAGFLFANVTGYGMMKKVGRTMKRALLRMICLFFCACRSF